jgi:3-isopropylmalate/(R)-2-methylmalate dehydratase small subunit
VMKDTISGKVYCLGDNIDTDQIIPAQYLSLNPAIAKEREAFGCYALSGVPKGKRGLPSGEIPFVTEGAGKSEFSVIIAGKNFGCGSSREHAPLSLKVAGCAVIIAEFYARIFFRNCVNGGYLLPLESNTRLCEEIKTGEEIEIRISGGRPILKTSQRKISLKPIGDILPIIQAGNVFRYAREQGMIPKRLREE